MSPLFRVRLPDGVEGDVMHVCIGEYTTETAFGPVRTTGHVGLLRLDDGTLTTRAIEGAQVVQRPPCDVPLPASPGVIR